MNVGDRVRVRLFEHIDYADTEVIEGVIKKIYEGGMGFSCYVDTGSQVWWVTPSIDLIEVI